MPVETDYKQVIAVRKDLHLGCGKIAAQVAHASLGAYEECLHFKPEWATGWRRCGWKKIVVRASNENEVLSLSRKANSLGIPSFIVRDAGLTQVEPNTLTCVGLGPGPSSIMDEISGKLKLL